MQGNVSELCISVRISAIKNYKNLEIIHLMNI